MEHDPVEARPSRAAGKEEVWPRIKGSRCRFVGSDAHVHYLDHRRFGAKAAPGFTTFIVVSLPFAPDTGMDVELIGRRDRPQSEIHCGVQVGVLDVPRSDGDEHAPARPRQQQGPLRPFRQRGEGIADTEERGGAGRDEDNA
jgi:hypothetical protein